jgi:hypothetical protein
MEKLDVSVGRVALHKPTLDDVFLAVTERKVP